MEKPNAATVAWYNANVPADPRAVKGQMFGHPCAFVNGNMFFGTFGQTLVARVGPTGVAASGLPTFEPMAGRAWAEYAQIHSGKLSDAKLGEMAMAALNYTATLPAKPEKKKPAKAKK